MFQDTTLSKTLSNKYRTHCETRHLNSIGMKRLFPIVRLFILNRFFGAGPYL